MLSQFFREQRVFKERWDDLAKPLAIRPRCAHDRVMELKPNPAYRRQQPWVPRGRALWVWRALAVAVVVWNLISNSWVIAAVFAAVWVGVELRIRRQSGRGRPGEGASY